MNDDYLWDRSGTRDPEIGRLEELLGPLRHDHRAGDIPVERLVRPYLNARRWRRLVPPLALAATRGRESDARARPDLDLAHIARGQSRG